MRRKGQISGEEGASAVEFALVLPVLVLLLAGIMDFGLVFHNLMSLRQGIGSSVRQGIVAQPGTTSSCPMPGASASSESTRRLICLTKQRIGLDENLSRTKISFPTVKTRGGSMVVCAQYPLDSATTVFDAMLNGILKARVEMRIEQDLSTFDPATETSLPGGDWAWCA